MNTPTEHRSSEPVVCTGATVERREDGIVITYTKASGGTLEQYLTFQEFFEFHEQFKAMLDSVTGNE